MDIVCHRCVASAENHLFQNPNARGMHSSTHAYCTVATMPPRRLQQLHRTWREPASASPRRTQHHSIMSTITCSLARAQHRTPTGTHRYNDRHPRKSQPAAEAVGQEQEKARVGGQRKALGDASSNVGCSTPAHPDCQVPAGRRHQVYENGWGQRADNEVGFSRTSTSEVNPTLTSQPWCAFAGMHICRKAHGKTHTDPSRCAPSLNS